MATRDSAFNLADPAFLQALMQPQGPQVPSAVIGQDPYLNQAMMTLGAGLMRATPPGGNAATGISDAFLGTLQNLQQQKAAAAEQAYKMNVLDQRERELQLAGELGASRSEVGRSQARYYDRLPAVSGSGSGKNKEELDLEKFEMSRKIAEAEWTRMSEVIEPEELKDKYPGGLAGYTMLIHRRMFPNQEITLDLLRRVWDEAKAKEAEIEAKAASTRQQTQAADANAQGDIQYSGDVQDILRQAKEVEALQQQRRDRAAAAFSLDERVNEFVRMGEPGYMSPRDELQRGGSGVLTPVQAAERLGDIQTFMTENQGKLNPRQQRQLVEAIRKLGKIATGAEQ